MTDTPNSAPGQPINLIKDAAEVIQQQALGSATSLVDYHSSGHCLVVGDIDTALSLIPRLAPLTVTVLSISDAPTQPFKQLTDSGIAVFTAASAKVSGHLGAFQVLVRDQDRDHDLAVMRVTETGMFDLLLDLSTDPLIDVRLPPFGYYRGNSEDLLEKALGELPQLVGEFDKPRYFDYNAQVCAHSRSSLDGCSQCIDICATNAISHSGEQVEVNPFLCQGCGSCATVCPTGAMTYAWPRPADAISKTRDLLAQHQSEATVLLLYSQTDEEESDSAFEHSLPNFIVPLAVEEVSAFGIDYWAAMLTAGFQQIVVLISDDPDDPNTHALQHQAMILRAVLSGIGPLDSSLTDTRGTDSSETDAAGNDSAVQFVARDSEAFRELLLRAEALPVRVSRGARFATHNDKRQTFRMAIDELVAGRETQTDVVPLPAGSPFGRINVDAENCTLCMACVSVCPAGAVLDGQEMPKLRFIESNCVQCGLCEKACPEQVISLTPQFTLDSTAARNTVTLNEEQPFHCVRCHKAFATEKMITTMTGKLSGHWMFSDEKAMRRLKMCEDCRVKDMFESEQGGIEVHRTPET